MWTISCTLTLGPIIQATQFHSYSFQGLKSGGRIQFPRGPEGCSEASTRGRVINRPEKANKMVGLTRKTMYLKGLKLDGRIPLVSTFFLPDEHKTFLISLLHKSLNFAKGERDLKQGSGSWLAERGPSLVLP